MFGHTYSYGRRGVVAHIVELGCSRCGCIVYPFSKDRGPFGRESELRTLDITREAVEDVEARMPSPVQLWLMFEDSCDVIGRTVSSTASPH